jgi:subtilisin family serine protease
MRVGIIDSGLENGHPALRGRVVENVAVEMGEDGPVVVPDEPQDLFGHATACGAIILSLAPDVELVSIRVLGADLRGKGTAFAAGLEWAIEQRLDVCNLSLSSKSEALYPIFHDLADRAYFQGTVLVSAANNVPAPSYPSLFSSVISVAAHPEADPWRLYYNPSPPVEFGAWGVDVPIAWKDGGHTVATGNSFAAPHVAGLVALILSKHPGLTPFEVKAILTSVADNPGRRHPWRRRAPSDP